MWRAIQNSFVARRRFLPYDCSGQCGSPIRTPRGKKRGDTTANSRCESPDRLSLKSASNVCTNSDATLPYCTANEAEAFDLLSLSWHNAADSMTGVQFLSFLIGSRIETWRSTLSDHEFLRSTHTNLQSLLASGSIGKRPSTVPRAVNFWDYRVEQMKTASPKQWSKPATFCGPASVRHCW